MFPVICVCFQLFAWNSSDLRAFPMNLHAFSVMCVRFQYSACVLSDLRVFPVIRVYFTDLRAF